MEDGNKKDFLFLQKILKLLLCSCLRGFVVVVCLFVFKHPNVIATPQMKYDHGGVTSGKVPHLQGQVLKEAGVTMLACLQHPLMSLNRAGTSCPRV